MKVISFSLWGDDPKYTIGAVRNAQLAREIYPDWEARFYCGRSVPAEMVDRIEDAGGRILDAGEEGDWRGMFWRFEAILDADVDAMIVRDCDSRLTRREEVAVSQWIQSTRGFHIMRDHPWHGTVILGGMWGMKRECLPEFGELMAKWSKEDRWQTDQDFLKAKVYPRVVHDAMVHADFFPIEPHAQRFPFPRDGFEFVGQVFDENEETIQEHVAMLQNSLRR